MGSLHLFLIDLIMKSLITLSLVVVFSDLSLQFYSPPIQRAAPEPVCRQVPNTVCADVQERKCQISQRPVQESVSRKQCRLQYRKDCKTAQDTRKQCSTVQDEQCYNVP